MERAVETLGELWRLLLQAWDGCSHGRDERFGYGEVHSQVLALLGCVEFYFKRKLKLAQINCSHRCLFCPLARTDSEG